MIIQRLDLTAFGHFTDVSIDLSTAAGARPFHLIFGANESGKSTSLRAITALFFGMPHLSEDNFLHANAQMRVGGLLVAQSGESLQCIRRRGRKGTLRDCEDDQPVDESRLSQMLGGIDRETFLSRFGLSHDELVAGGDAILQGGGDLGEILFAAGAGVSQLRNVQLELDEASKKLFAPRGNKTINTAVKELEERRKELRQAQLPPAEFTALRQQIEQKRADRSRLGQQMQKVVLELSKLQACSQTLPLIPQWRSTIEELAEFAGSIILDEGFTQRRRQVESDRELAVAQQQDLQQRAAELTGRLEAMSEDAGVLHHETEIQTLFQEVGTRDKADRDRIDLVRVQKNADRKIHELLRELSVNVLTDDETDTADAVEDSVQRLRISDSLRTRVHELSAKYQRLVGQRDDAADAVATIKKRLDDLSRERKLLTVPADPTALGGVIDAVGAPAALLETLAAEQEDCQQLQRKCESLLQRLDGFQGTYRQAARIRPPSLLDVDRYSEEMSSTASKLAGLQMQRETLCRRRDEAIAQLDRQQSDAPLPTPQQLRQVRDRRDRIVNELVERSQDADALEEQVDSIRQAIRSSDEMVDTIRDHHQEVHRRERMREEIESIEKQAAELQAEIESSESQLKSHKLHWQSIWDACDVTADSPPRMKQWLADHGQLVQVFGRLEDQRDRCEQSRRRVQRATARLRAAVEAVAASKVVAADSSCTQVGLFDDQPEHDLVSLYDEAVSLRSELSRLRHQYDSLCRRREEQAEELPLAETRLETCQKNVQQWQQEWQRVTQSFADTGDTDPTAVIAMIRRIDQLCEKKRERDILAKRIGSIGDDELTFRNRVHRLADALEWKQRDQAEPSAIIQVLYQRLQHERTASRQREMLREQIDQVGRQLEQQQQKQASCDIVLKQLCDEAGCQSHDQLPEIERRSRRHQQLQSSLRDLENQLTLLAGDEPIEDFIDWASQQSPPLLDVEIEQKEEELGEVRRSMSEADQEIGALQHQADSTSGSSHASDLLQSMQLLAGKIGRDAEEFARLKIASFLLRRAIDHYRSENQSPVLTMAEGVFRQLTCGEYQSLKVDYDAKGNSILFGVRTAGDVADVPAPAMSTGTADALYLSLRLASLKHQLGQGGEPVPLIVDDCLIQMDDARAIQAIRALSELSLQTQVLMFTHHQHLIELMQTHLDDGQYHVHHLQPS